MAESIGVTATKFGKYIVARMVYLDSVQETGPELKSFLELVFQISGRDSYKIKDETIDSVYKLIADSFLIIKHFNNINELDFDYLFEFINNIYGVVGPENSIKDVYNEFFGLGEYTALLDNTLLNSNFVNVLKKLDPKDEKTTKFIRGVELLTTKDKVVVKPDPVHPPIKPDPFPINIEEEEEVPLTKKSKKKSTPALPSPDEGSTRLIQPTPFSPSDEGEGMESEVYVRPTFIKPKPDPTSSSSFTRFMEQETIPGPISFIGPSPNPRPSPGLSQIMEQETRNNIPKNTPAAFLQRLKEIVSDDDKQITLRIKTTKTSFVKQYRSQGIQYRFNLVFPLDHISVDDTMAYIQQYNEGVEFKQNGVFATKKFNVGDIVTTVGGVFEKTKQYENLEGEHYLRVCKLTGDLYIVGSKKTNANGSFGQLVRSTKRQQDVNVFPFLYQYKDYATYIPKDLFKGIDMKDDNSEGLFLIANRQINVGEQIFMDKEKYKKDDKGNIYKHPKDHSFVLLALIKEICMQYLHYQTDYTFENEDLKRIFIEYAYENVTSLFISEFTKEDGDKKKFINGIGSKGQIFKMMITEIKDSYDRFINSNHTTGGSLNNEEVDTMIEQMAMDHFIHSILPWYQSSPTVIQDEITSLFCTPDAKLGDFLGMFLKNKI
jgi:hypothetical protein